MERGTGLARTVGQAMGDYDAECKLLLSEKQVLARVMHEWLEEFSGLDVGQIERECFEDEPRVGSDPVDRDASPGRVRSLSEEDTTLGEGTTTFDVRFTARVPGTDGELVHIEMDVEAQRKYHPGYPITCRGMFYVGRLLSLQGERVIPGAHYELVRKAVSIWVCTHVPRRLAGTVTSFRMVPECFVGDARFERAEYDLAEVIMVCLDDESPGSSAGTLGMLEVLLSRTLRPADKLKVLRDGYGIMVSEDMGERMGDMCNLGEGIYLEGIEVGREEGREEKLLENLRSLMEELGLTADAALKALRVPEADRPRILALL